MVPRVLQRLNRSRTLKRAIDLTVAGGALCALAPVMTGLAAAVVVAHGWPAVFVQRRPGKNGQPFAMYKFRTMTNERDADGELLPDDRRLTAFGSFLRRTSLDELPELINVLRGEMSLVGPRPLLMQYLERYTPEQMRRHEVPPGITGLAQVRGRNALSWEEKFAWDLSYVDDWSNARDLAILFETVRVVFDRSGVSHDGSVTMPEFMGS